MKCTGRRGGAGTLTYCSDWVGDSGCGGQTSDSDDDGGRLEELWSNDDRDDEVLGGERREAGLEVGGNGRDRAVASRLPWVSVLSLEGEIALSGAEKTWASVIREGAGSVISNFSTSEQAKMATLSLEKCCRGGDKREILTVVSKGGRFNSRGDTIRVMVWEGTESKDRERERERATRTESKTEKTSYMAQRDRRKGEQIHCSKMLKHSSNPTVVRRFLHAISLVDLFQGGSACARCPEEKGVRY